MGKPSDAGMEALRRLKSTDPPLWQAPSASLSEMARAASQHLFSYINTYAPKSPFDQLLVDGFDAEQIWQQIDLQSQPLLASLRRKVKYFEKNPEEIEVFQKVLEGEKNVIEKKEKILPNEVDDDDMDMDMDEVDDDDEEEEEEDEDEEGGGEERGSGDEEREMEGEGGIEDKFLKIKELEEYLEEDEAREYGLDTKENKKKTKSDGRKNLIDEDEDEEEEEEEEEGEEDEEDEDDELGVFNGGDDDDEEEDKLEHARC